MSLYRMTGFVFVFFLESDEPNCFLVLNNNKKQTKIPYCVRSLDLPIKLNISYTSQETNFWASHLLVLHCVVSLGKYYDGTHAHLFLPVMLKNVSPQAIRSYFIGAD